MGSCPDTGIPNSFLRELNFAKMGRVFVARKSGKAISVPANVSGSVEYKLTVTSMSSALFSFLFWECRF